MKDEIKEILDKLNKLEYDDIHLIICEVISRREIKILLDCITNLQEEVEDLRESDWAWHQTLKAQNKREYRSKFLKEFQEEYGTNTFPDYDEIYKRYDKVKKENERLKEVLKNNGVVKTCENCEWFGVCPHSYREYDYKLRNEKAIEYINENKHLSMFADCREPEEDWNYNLEINPRELLNILQGSDKDE